MNRTLEKNPNFNHEIMGSVLQGFREFAEKRDDLDVLATIAKGVKSAYDGEESGVMSWIEKVKSKTELPMHLPKSKGIYVSVVHPRF